MWTETPARILVPVDFGDASARALRVAGAVANQAGAELLLLHAEVLDVPPYFTADQLKALETERQAGRAKAREYLADFARGQGVGRFTSRIVEGLPTSAILEAAARAHLVVMGTHGRRGPARWWMGSVAERVIHESRTPVLVVRAGGSQAPEEIFRDPMLVSTVGTPDTDAVQAARSLAGLFGGEVSDRAARCEADLANARHASLVVVSTGDRHGVLLGHPAEQWLRNCTLPMLFVPRRESKGGESESSAVGSVVHQD